MIRPTRTAPKSDPTNAPTMPPQKRSGRKIVKCQIARPIITHASIPIRPHPPFANASSGHSPRSAVTAVARTPALVARLGCVLEHEILRREVRGRIATHLGLLLGLDARGLLRDARARRSGSVRGGQLLIDIEVADQLLELFS